MLRTPRRNPSRCSCGTCRVCTDPITAGMSALAAAGDMWKTANLNQGGGWGAVFVNPAIVGAQLPPNPKRPPLPPLDVDGFAAEMAALTNQVHPRRVSDGQDRR